MISSKLFCPTQEFSFLMQSVKVRLTVSLSLSEIHSPLNPYPLLLANL